MKLNLGTKQKGVKMCLNPPQNKQTENPTHPWSQNVKVIIFLLWTSVPVLCGWKCHKYTLYYTGKISGLAFLDRLREDLCKKKLLKDKLSICEGSVSSSMLQHQTNF